MYVLPSGGMLGRLLLRVSLLQNYSQAVAGPLHPGSDLLLSLPYSEINALTLVSLC